MKDEKIIKEPSYDSMSIEKDESTESEMEKEEHIPEWKYRMLRTFFAGH